MKYKEFGNFVSTIFASFRDETGNSPYGKYKVGQYVIYVGDKFPEYYNQAFQVTSVNETDEEVYEYTLAEFPYLVWESEIKAL